jgi:hypothetical protein
MSIMETPNKSEWILVFAIVIGYESHCDWTPKFLHWILSGLERVLFGSRLGFVAV